MKTLYLAAAILLLPGLVFCQSHSRVSVRVDEVLDGDTVVVSNPDDDRIFVSLYGIDAPEMRLSRKRYGQPGGAEAKNTLSRMLKGKEVDLEIVGLVDGRGVSGILWVGRRNVNREMVSAGMAWAVRKGGEEPAFASEYLEAEMSARQKKAGIWGTALPLPPWVYRSEKARLPKAR